MTSDVPSSRQPVAAVLLPHTGPARLITEIVRSGPGFVEAMGRVSTGHPLVVAGRAPCVLGIELGAQAAAAMEALHRPSATGEQVGRIGYLVRVREAAFLMPDLPADTPLCVTARLEATATPLAVHRICVSVGGTEFLTAVLSTFSRAR